VFETETFLFTLHNACSTGVVISQRLTDFTTKCCCCRCYERCNAATDAY